MNPDLEALKADVGDGDSALRKRYTGGARG